MKTPFEPNLKTRPEDLCKEELNKLHAKNGIEGNLRDELHDSHANLSWETEQIIKAHGIYLEHDRALKGPEKSWIYMMRVAIPGGGPISSDQWLVLDDLSETYTADPQGAPSLRLTTRQNIQFHWIKKDAIIPMVQAIVKSGLKTLNGCGDVMRNPVACPLSAYSDIFNANEWAKKIADYFRLPAAPHLRIFEIDQNVFEIPEKTFAYGPQLLNRKFKIAFSALHRDPQTGEIIPDNCTEFISSDAGIAPITMNGKIAKFQIYVGGGQGERNSKPSAAMLAQPLGIVTPEQLLPALDAIVSVQQEWGDRQNRFWARLKYLIKKMGIVWFRERVEERLGFKLEPPDPNLDYGNHHLHHGWHVQPNNGHLAFGMFIENGRIKDGTPNGNIKTMVRELVKKYRPELVVTPNQNLILANLPVEGREEFEKDLARFGYDRRNGKPFSKLRLHSSACVGLDTCALAYTESEKFEPLLLDELEKLGWGELATSIGLTGCERQCDRPATKAIGLIGSGLNRYQLKLLGTEDGRHLGQPVIVPETQKMYLRSIPREKIAVLLDALFKFYMKKKDEGESLGYFHRRIGIQSIIRHLAENPDTSTLMESTSGLDFVLD